MTYSIRNIPIWDAVSLTEKVNVEEIPPSKYGNNLLLKDQNAMEITY